MSYERSLRANGMCCRFRSVCRFCAPRLSPLLLVVPVVRAQASRVVPRLCNKSLSVCMRVRASIIHFPASMFDLCCERRSDTRLPLAMLVPSRHLQQTKNSQS